MNIILIGFMASGKSTIGKALAERKGLKLLDTDEVIEVNAEMSIKDIFESYGEAHFRELERKAIESLRGIDNSVVSIGGGAVMFHNNFQTLKSIGLTVFLDAPLQKIIKNLEGKFRPLVGNTIDVDKMQKLLESRYETYKKADVVINTENLDVNETVEEILRVISIKE